MIAATERQAAQSPPSTGRSVVATLKLGLLHAIAPRQALAIVILKICTCRQAACADRSMPLLAGMQAPWQPGSSNPWAPRTTSAAHLLVLVVRILARPGVGVGEDKAVGAKVHQRLGAAGVNVLRAGQRARVGRWCLRTGRSPGVNMAAIAQLKVRRQCTRLPSAPWAAAS